MSDGPLPGPLALQELLYKHESPLQTSRPGSRPLRRYLFLPLVPPVPSDWRHLVAQAQWLLSRQLRLCSSEENVRSLGYTRSHSLFGPIGGSVS